MGTKASEEVEKAAAVESGMANLKIAVTKSREMIEAHPLISIAIAFGLGIVFASLLVRKYGNPVRNDSVDLCVNGMLRLTPEPDRRALSHKSA